ncbi:MAG: HDOD domain-containing protein [Gammaproteobacteria bacterium]|nr:HDOD domain-containing protein [Gammaproteobacteria bacterium]
MRPEDLVKGVIRLASLPDMFIRISQMVDDPRSSGNMIARIIGEDPALTARLLRIANSPLYGFTARIDTIARAITVIGTRGLRDLVLAYAALDIMGRFKGGLIDLEDYRRRSLLCALVARLLGVRARVADAESLFVAGLLYDIGQLIIADKLPEMARETLLRAKDSGAHLHLLERGVIGFNHAEVGGELLRQWLLPDALWEAVKCHHAPGEARNAVFNAALVHLAAVIADSPFTEPLRDANKTPLAEYLAREVDPIGWAITGLNADTLIEVHAEAIAQLAQLTDTLFSQAA